MNIRFIILAVATLTLVACASSITPVPFKGPNGKQAYTMRCTGKGRTIEMCNRKAAGICPNGYEVIEEKKPELSKQQKAAAMMDDTVSTAPEHLSVECK